MRSYAWVSGCVCVREREGEKERGRGVDEAGKRKIKIEFYDSENEDCFICLG